MKSTNSIFKVTVALLLTATIFSACKKDKDATVSFHLHTLVGSTAAAYGVQLQTAAGRKFDIADFRYYLSHIVLINSDGTERPMTDKVLLVNPAQHDYELGVVPIGSYKGFKFMVGLDSLTNHADPTTFPATDPLAIQSPANHWDWNSGYIFMKVEGMVDTTFAANGALSFPYFYHVGMDDFKRTIDFSTSAFTVESNDDSANEITMQFDLLQMLSNVDMRTENVTHTMNNMPLATKIANNWQSAFRLQ